MRIKYVLSKLQKRFLEFSKHPLTKSNPAAAFYRYIKFNLVQNLEKKPRVYNWIHDLKFYAQKGEAGIVGNIYVKLFDYEDSMFLLHNLKAQDLFIDVGANVGHYSLLAAGVCKADVIAFEPIPSTFFKLEANLKLNSLSQKVKAYNIGIGDENAILNFTKSKDVMNSVALRHEKEVISVEVKKLDDLLIEKNPTFIKIDVEGYEYFVLKGAINVLKTESLKYLIVELNSSTLKFGHTNEEIVDFLFILDFIPIEYDVENKLITKLKTYNTKKFNTIFIKRKYLN